MQRRSEPGWRYRRSASYLTPLTVSLRQAFNSETDNFKLSYGGHQYHASCANFWINCVEPKPPGLILPDLLWASASAASDRRSGDQPSRLPERRFSHWNPPVGGFSPLEMSVPLSVVRVGFENCSVLYLQILFQAFLVILHTYSVNAALCYLQVNYGNVYRSPPPVTHKSFTVELLRCFSLIFTAHKSMLLNYRLLGVQYD